jgi:predicted dehydrogenase
MGNDRELGFAIIGTGAIAGTHADAIGAVEGIRLRAVYNRTEATGRAFAEGRGVDWEPSLDGILGRDDIDVVCVATASGAHEQVAVPALQNGKHVLCEKPLEVNVEKVDRILAAAKANNRILAAVFQSRMSPHGLLLKTAIEEGRFGRLALCSAYIKWWRDQAYYDSGAWRGTWDLDGGGALMNQSIHYVDLLQWLVGMPDTVHAFIATRAHEGLEVEDVTCAALRFGNGALGVIEAATACYPGYERRIEICGDDGSAVLEDNTLAKWEFREPRPEDIKVLEEESDLKIAGGTSNPMSITSDGHRLQIIDLVDAIRHGREPRIPGDEGRNAIHLIECIYRSAKSGNPVTV